MEMELYGAMQELADQVRANVLAEMNDEILNKMREKARKKLLAEIRAECVKQGIRDTQEANIIRMLQGGSLSFSEISKYLGVSLRQVKSIAQELDIPEK